MDPSQIQGLTFSPFRGLGHSVFLFTRVTDRVDPSPAKAALRELSKLVTYGKDEGSAALNVAFTYPGLSALGLNDALLRGFSREFAEGMHDEDRARAMGDIGEASPENWAWGSGERHADAVFLLYGKDAPSLEALRAKVVAAWADAFRSFYEKPGARLTNDREHFGFRDGISQPRFEGDETHPDFVPAGEFVLGYPNIYGKLILDPEVPEHVDREGFLAGSFGRNGTYLVLREVLQDVRAFWSYLDEATRRPDGSSDPGARDALGAKLVGRHKDGRPLANPNATDDDLNAFDYRDDKAGLMCPVGAHVRRANPRDSLDPTREDSITTVRARRILRRGRSFGSPNFEPLDNPEPSPVDRGLMFICLNANIRRQFEFIQQTWTNNVKFAGLYDERDPLIGAPATSFTIPTTPLRRRLEAVPAFTKLRGGGYFFLPGKRALEYLCR